MQVGPDGGVASNDAGPAGSESDDPGQDLGMTRRQIAELTGYSMAAVATWAATPGFPAARSTTGHGALVYPTREVIRWHRDHVLGDPSRPGGRLPRSTVRSGGSGRLSLTEIGRRHGISRRAVNYYALTYATGPDPFPPADGDGLRPADAVAAWLTRRQAAASASKGNRTPRPTPRQDRVRALRAEYAARGQDLTAAELAAVLGVHPDSARRLLRRTPPG